MPDGADAGLWLAAAALLGALLAGCGPKTPEAAAPPAETAVASPLRGAPEFAGCKWQEVKGRTLAIQGFACGPGHGNLRIVADDALPGFQRETQGPDGRVRSVAVRVFAKAADAPLKSVLGAVRAASPGRFTAACVFAPATSVHDEGGRRFVLEPAGEQKPFWEASVASDTPIEWPCGPLGVSIAGDRYFEVLPQDPRKVVFVEMGSEIQNFDPATLRSLD